MLGRVVTRSNLEQIFYLALLLAFSCSEHPVEEKNLDVLSSAVSCCQKMQEGQKCLGGVVLQPVVELQAPGIIQGISTGDVNFNGWILIDRCGTHFGIILKYLRDGSVVLPDSPKDLAELLAEAKYYCITDLAISCERALVKTKEPEPICRIPLITSQKEEQLLISSSTKPVVKLLVNRHNNKYSYTNTSDDNLLKNIELFDKLSLRFSGRILFIKDVIGSSEICCWSFYGHGKKVAEVCCTSIVYATDRKHTKVEFPEARIYEETLQVLLYENRNAPDQELLQATSSVHGGVGAGGLQQYTSDEEEERTGLARLRSNKRNNPT